MNVEYTSDEKTFLLSCVLMVIGFFAESARMLVDNYDVLLKVLTIGSLTSVIILNLISAVNKIVSVFNNKKDK